MHRLLAEIGDSVRRIGWRRTAAVAISRLGDAWFDFRYDVETVEVSEVGDLAAVSANLKHAERYQPSSRRGLDAILDALAVESQDVFVDYGCGRGRALLLAARRPLARVIGIEFSPPLCAIARRNVERFAARSRQQLAPIEVIEADATEVELHDDETIFYFFRPFGQTVLDGVLRRIEASLTRAPRRVTLVYYLPPPDLAVEDRSRFRLAVTLRVAGYDCHLYRTEEPAT